MMSLKRLMVVERPNVLFIQETMGCSGDIRIEICKLFLGWSFVCLDSSRASRGIIMRYSSYCTLTKWHAIFLGMVTKLHYKYLDYEIIFFNIYMPYEDQEAFWHQFFSLSVF